MTVPQIIAEMDRQIALGREFPGIAQQSLDACRILLDLLKIPLVERPHIAKPLQNRLNPVTQITDRQDEHSLSQQPLQ